MNETRINIDELISEYNKNNIITLENFLLPEIAEEVWNNVYNIQDRNWSYSCHPYDPCVFTFENNQQNKETIEKAIVSATESYYRGEFSYLFRRYEYEGKFKNIIQSDKLYELIEKITGHKVSATISVFASCYHAKCFLNTHTDIGRGKIAFVYNLSKDWNPSNEGCFQLLSESNWGHVVKQVNPAFNSLTLFTVVNKGVPHRVTRIVDSCPDRRIAISGWLV